MSTWFTAWMVTEKLTIQQEPLIKEPLQAHSRCGGGSPQILALILGSFLFFFFKVHIKTVDSKICGLSRVMHHCLWKNVAVNCNIFKIISNNLSWLTQNYGLPLVIRNLGQPTFKKKHQYMLTLHGHAWADTACLYILNKLTGVCTMMRAYVCVHSRKHNEVCMTFAQCPKNTGWGDTFSAQGLMK